METTSKKNAEGTEMWIDREELKSVIDNTEIGAMNGVILIACGTNGLLLKAKGADDTLLKAMTYVAQHDTPFLVLMMRTIESIRQNWKRKEARHEADRKERKGKEN